MHKSRNKQSSHTNPQNLRHNARHCSAYLFVIYQLILYVKFYVNKASLDTRFNVELCRLQTVDFITRIVFRRTRANLSNFDFLTVIEKKVYHLTETNSLLVTDLLFRIICHSGSVEEKQANLGTDFAAKSKFTRIY